MSNRDRYEERGLGQDLRAYGRGEESPRREHSERYAEDRSWRDHRHAPREPRDYGVERDDHRDPRDTRGYREASGQGSYGWGGYGPRERGADESYRVGGPTYGDTRDDHLARRSRWREDQRHDDPRPGGRAGYDARIDHHDHEPHYRQWRDQQLSDHDRDYARWREQQADAYDAQYRTWRQQRHDAFAADFHNWRAGQTAASADPTAGADVNSGPIAETATEEVQSVTDGHTRTHRVDDSDDDRRH